jgi:hypothetical protein
LRTSQQIINLKPLHNEGFSFWLVHWTEIGLNASWLVLDQLEWKAKIPIKKTYHPSHLVGISPTLRISFGWSLAAQFNTLLVKDTWVRFLVTESELQDAVNCLWSPDALRRVLQTKKKLTLYLEALQFFSEGFFNILKVIDVLSLRVPKVYQFVFDYWQLSSVCQGFRQQLIKILGTNRVTKKAKVWKAYQSTSSKIKATWVCPNLVKKSPRSEHSQGKSQKKFPRFWCPDCYSVLWIAFRRSLFHFLAYPYSCFGFGYCLATNRLGLELWWTLRGCVRGQLMME